MARAPKPLKEKLTKPTLITEIAEDTGLSKTDVGLVLDSLATQIQRSISKRGVKEFKLPGILKITSKRKPATKARPGRNPRTGEPITYAAKPAHNAVTVKALTKLKEWAN